MDNGNKDNVAPSISAAAASSDLKNARQKELRKDLLNKIVQYSQPAERPKFIQPLRKTKTPKATIKNTKCGTCQKLFTKRGINRHKTNCIAQRKNK